MLWEFDNYSLINKTILVQLIPAIGPNLISHTYLAELDCSPQIDPKVHVFDEIPNYQQNKKEVQDLLYSITPAEKPSQFNCRPFLSRAVWMIPTWKGRDNTSCCNKLSFKGSFIKFSCTPAIEPFIPWKSYSFIGKNITELGSYFLHTAKNIIRKSLYPMCIPNSLDMKVLLLGLYMKKGAHLHF